MICGKIIYSSQSEAKKVLAGVNGDKRPTTVNSKPHVAYYCDACEGWHVASRSKRKFTKSRTEQIITIKAGQKAHPQDQTLKIRDFTSKTKSKHK